MGMLSALPARMRVSIVVPVHNDAAALSECVRALVGAAGQETEIVVVDDGSTDDSAAVAERAGVRCLRLGRRLGAAAARDRGARDVTGDVILFVDADVVVTPDTVRVVADVLADHPHAAA